MRVIKRNSEIEDVSFDKILNRLKNLSSGLTIVYYAVKAVVDYGIEIQMVLKIFIKYHTII